MICLWCRDQAHGMCRGGTWCDCAHRVDPLVAARELQVKLGMDDVAFVRDLRHSAMIMEPVRAAEYRRMADAIEGDGPRLSGTGIVAQESIELVGE